MHKPVGMKRLFILISFCFLHMLSIGQSRNESTIRNLLEVQRIHWNNGNIDRFMEGYWKNDSLMFIGKSGVTYGWQNTLNNYKKGYPDPASMGQLKFDIIQVKRLSSKYFSVVGKWHLTRTVGDIGGHFTLLVKKFGKVWLIISDHSS